MLLRKHKSYIYIALVLFALASVAFPKTSIAFELSVPTEVNATLMPDGTVINPSFSTGTNTSEDPLVVSGDLSLNSGFEGSLVFNNQNNTKDIEVNVGDKIDGSVDITKIDNSLDYSKKNIIGSINWSIQPKIKTAFAVFSQDDGSLNFYKRYEVPKAGEQFEGKTATEVYTGIETNRHVPWRFDCGSITNSRVVDKIKPIDTSSWFSACSKLTSIDLSNLDTSAVTDMSAMFVRCSNLTTLDLSGFDTSSVTDMRSMFSDCSSLTTLDLSGFDTSSVIDMGWMFEGCSSLTSLEISNFNTSSVKSMGSMFRNCRKLPQLDLSHFNTYKVTTMRDMFSGCEALTALNITSWNTQAVTNMNSMFFNCFKLTTLDFSSFNASSVTDMGSMFWNCVSLTSLDLSSFNTPAVTDMSFMFSYCRSLVSLNLANFDTSSVTNMNSMFFDCPSLASLDLANFDTSNVTSMRSMFYGCSSLTTLNVSNFNTSSVSSMDSMFENCNELLSLNITNFNTSNVESMSRMFQNCYKLNNLDLSSFNTSSVISIDSMFGSCRNLTTLDLSNFDTSNVTSMSSMFYGCYRLQQIKLGNKFAWKGNGGYLPTPSSRYIPGADGKWYAMSDGAGYAPKDIPSNKADTYVASPNLLPKEAFAVFSAVDNSLNFYKRSRVPKAGEQFEGKTVTEVYTGIETDEYTNIYDIPWKNIKTQIVKSNVVDPIKPKSTAYWFALLYSLTDLDLMNLDTSFVKNMDSMFFNCTSLPSINLSNFNTSSVTNMNNMFAACSSIISIDLSSFDSSSVTSMQNILGANFRLTEITLGDKFEWKGIDGYLHAPSENNIPGADGKWYAMSDKKGYAPADIPSNKADTYYASKDLLPKMTGNIQISGSNSPGSTLSANVEGVPSDANIGYQWYIGVGSKDFEYVVTDIFVDDGIRSKVGEATLSDKDIILFKGQETGSYSMDAEVINSSGAVVFKKTFNENSNSAYFKPSESGVYKVKVRLISGSTYFDATKRALEFEKIDGETSKSLNILDNQEYRTFMCKAFDKSGKYLGEISSEKVTITPKAKLLK